MAWLVCDGRVLATLEVATSWKARARGLLGRDGIDGALLLRPACSVHTLRMRFPIDVAFCDGDLRVLKVVTLPPNRVTRPVVRARCVVECEAGMLRRWDIHPGTRLEVRGLDVSPSAAPGARDDAPAPGSPPAGPAPTVALDDPGAGAAPAPPRDPAPR